MTQNPKLKPEARSPMAIKIKNFSKSFGRKKVIDDLSFEVKKGEIFAFLGPNGSGKTTTIRCLLEIYQEDMGEVTINGEKYSSQMSNMIGYLPEERGLYLNMKAFETLVFWGELKGLTNDEASNKAEKYLKLVDLWDKKDSRIKNLSSGQQQKVQMGITIIHDPEILILDEPTKGLDPVNRKLLLDIILEHNKKGATVIFSTHILDDVERIADRVLILKNGRAGAYGTIAELKKEFSENVLKIWTNDNIKSNNKMYDLNEERYVKKLMLKEKVDKNDVLKQLIQDKVAIDKFEFATPTLEDIFIKVTNE